MKYILWCILLFITLFFWNKKIRSPYFAKNQTAFRPKFVLNIFDSKNNTKSGENRNNFLVITTFLANMIQSVFKFGMTKPTAVCFPNYKSFMTAVKSVFMIIWPHHWQDFLHLAITRSSCWDVFCKKGVLKIFGVYFLTHLFQCIHSLTVFWCF